MGRGESLRGRKRKNKERWWHGRKAGDSRALSFGEMWGILQHGKISILKGHMNLWLTKFPL
jgi:hypothetical protein